VSQTETTNRILLLGEDPRSVQSVAAAFGYAVERQGTAEIRIDGPSSLLEAQMVSGDLVGILAATPCARMPPYENVFYVLERAPQQAVLSQMEQQ